MFANIIILSRLIYGLAPSERKSNKLISSDSLKKIEKLADENRELEDELQKKLKLPKGFEAFTGLDLKKNEKDKIQIKDSFESKPFKDAEIEKKSKDNTMAKTLKGLENEKESNGKIIEAIENSIKDMAKTHNKLVELVEGLKNEHELKIKAVEI